MVVFKTIVPRYRLLGAWSLGDFWARLFQEEVCTLNRPSALNGLPRRPGWQLPEISRPDRGVSSPSSSLPTLSLSLSPSPHLIEFLILSTTNKNYVCRVISGRPAIYCAERLQPSRNRKIARVTGERLAKVARLDSTSASLIGFALIYWHLVLIDSPV